MFPCDFPPRRPGLQCSVGRRGGNSAGCRLPSLQYTTLGYPGIRSTEIQENKPSNKLQQLELFIQQNLDICSMRASCLVGSLAGAPLSDEGRGEVRKPDLCLQALCLALGSTALPAPQGDSAVSKITHLFW